MDELTRQRQRIVLEIACKADDPEVWKEALSTIDMKDFISDPKNEKEIKDFLKKYNHPAILVWKIQDMRREGEEILSTFLL